MKCLVLGDDPLICERAEIEFSAGKPLRAGCQFGAGAKR